MSDVLLGMADVRSGYARVEVLHGVDVEVRRGEMVTIIGSNGAGKSTLLKTIVGIVPLSGGELHILGTQYAKPRPERLVREGVALVPEGRLLFGTLSVEENLRLGAYRLTDRRRATEARMAAVHELFPVLAARAAQPAATLSGGEQQMLAVGRALMSAPKLLLLDEPSLGLAPRVIAEIFTALDALKAQGVTIVLVEQDARLALKHADRGYVMKTGRVALEGPAEALLRDETIRSIYLGSGDGRGGAA